MRKHTREYVNIKLEGFSFFHRASSSEHEDRKYLHRYKIEQKLKNWLSNNGRHGTYLVSGYRGVGKSSLVGAVIGQLKRENKDKYIDVCVNIGQENINELHILQIIAKNLQSELIKTVWRSKSPIKLYDIFDVLNRHGHHIILLNIFSIILSFLCRKFTSSSYVSFFMDSTAVAPGPTDAAQAQGFSLFDILPEALLWCSITCLALYLIQKIFRKTNSVFKAIDKLELLCARFNTKTTYKVSAQSGFEQFQFGSISKENEVQTANIQEIEYELSHILANYKKRKIIIVLDELDKTEPEYAQQTDNRTNPEYEDVAVRPEQRTTSRTRRKQVLNVIANMKFFLSTADAYFIFIAGRELHEASMADMSDREFSISNIFNGILNVDSFFFNADVQDVTKNTEYFVCQHIIPSHYYNGDDTKRQSLTLQDYRRYRLSAPHRQDIEQINYEVLFLYHFINYLAFISNGSPKKITQFFERYIRSYRIIRNNRRIDPSDYPNESDDSLWLSFGRRLQMKINFVHYLTYPVMQNIMSRSQIFGDKLQVSMSFIVAHIFKMHNGGFSWRNLEHTPEILGINRSPEIRDYISSIARYLNHTHLTTISCGLYQYKFPMRIAEEISYFSKLSDEFSALFNFSPDELQSVKEHYFQTLDYNKRNNLQSTDMDTYAEASIRHSLGDIYMQEENYASAIRQFEKSIEITVPLLSKSYTSFNQQQNYLLFYNRTVLKLGLAHEKRHTDNSAYTIYSDLIQQFLWIRRYNPETASLFRDNRTMHLGILARLYVIEKLDTTGIIQVHIDEAQDIFRKLFYARHYGLSHNQQEINRIVAADFYRKLGDILYYKNNRQLYKAKKCYLEGIRILLEIEYSINDIKQELRKEKNVTSSVIARMNSENNSIFNKIVKYLRNRKQGNEDNTTELSPNNTLYNLAILFESLGHTYFQTPFTTKHKQPHDSKNELNVIKNFILDINSEITWPRNTLVRSILCYWGASELYGMSCERDLAGRCYKQMIRLMKHIVNLASTHGILKDDVDILQEITEFLVRRTIMSQYRQYEHINLSEITNLSRIYDTQNTEYLLNYLSLYPDINEIQCLYVSFLVSCHKFYKDKPKYAARVRNIEHQIAAFIHKELAFLHNTTNSTLTNIVTRRSTCASIYMYFITTLLLEPTIKPGNGSGRKPVIPTDFPHTSVKDFILNKGGEFPIAHLVRESMETTVPADKYTTSSYRFNLIKEILTNAIYCYSYILHRIEPMNTTTIVNHTFVGDVYLELAVVQRLLDQLCEACGFELISDNNRITIRYEYSDEPAIGDEDRATFRKELTELYDYDFMSRNIRRSNENYLVENAIHSYTKARQCSSEEHAYQELIRELYFLDDDLNNDTIQPFLAIERATAQTTREKENRLKKEPAYNKSPYYDIDNYNLEDTVYNIVAAGKS